MNQKSIIILAAGQGTRMKSDTPKVLHRISGKPMLYYSIKEALKLGANVSIVFNETPAKWEGFDIIDGDKADDLMINLRGQLIGLRAKGKAKKDTSNFVVTI